LSVSIFEKTPLLRALQTDESQSQQLPVANQLNLFMF
jgi:hypothetical protein